MSQLARTFYLFFFFECESRIAKFENIDKRKIASYINTIISEICKIPCMFVVFYIDGTSDERS